MSAKKNGLMFLLLLVGIFCVVLNFLGANAVLEEHWYDSDSLYLPGLFKNVLSGGGRISDWYFTPAPYFFPDYPVFALAYFLGGSLYAKIIIFAILQVFLAALAIWFLARRCAVTHPFFIAVPVLIFFLALAFGVGSPFYLIMRSAFHYGSFLVGILVVALCLLCRDRLREGQNKSNAVLLFLLGALSFLTALSDNLFIVQVAAPLVVTEVFLAFIERDFSLKYRLPALVVFVAGVLGSISYPFLVEHPTRYASDLSLLYFIKRLPLLFDFSMKVVNYNVLPILTFLIYLAVVLYSLIFFKRENESRPGIFYLVVYSFCSIGVTIFFVCASTKLLPADRHLLSVYSFPIIVVFIYFGNYLASRGSFILSLVTVCLTGFLCFGTYFVVNQNGIKYQRYPESAACIDQALEGQGAANGIAEYWTARPQQLFSKLPLTIAQFQRKGLYESHWITSSKYFRDSYDFAIIPTNRLEGYQYFVTRMIALNGPPKAVKSCADNLVYLYEKGGIHSLDIIRKPGESLNWPESELSTQVNEHTPVLSPEEQKIRRSDAQVIAAHGQVSSGDYALQIEYSNSGGQGGAGAATWDVHMQDLTETLGGSWPTIRSVAKGTMPITGAELGKAQGTFFLDTGKDMAEIDIEVWAPEKADVRVKSIRLERIR